ncbi:MAG: hypothetical protein ACREBU_02930 [Nitrososphaera sp.]
MVYTKSTLFMQSQIEQVKDLETAIAAKRLEKELRELERKSQEELWSKYEV